MNNTWKGILTGGASSLMGRNRKSGGYEFQPYSGLRPPRIDYTTDQGQKVEYLRPTQDLTQKTIMDRSQGIGVGYDPQRTKLLMDLARSQNQMSLEDSLRSAKGSIAASGLSGNPRAYEAIAGRAQRDSARSLDNSMKEISVSDLERANQERDINTARLQALNTSNFGQENNAANFDFNVYNAEQGNRLDSEKFNQGQYEYDTGRSDKFTEGLIELGAMGAGAYLGGPTGAYMGQQVGRSVTGNQSGTGISPNYSGLTQTPSFYNEPLNSRSRNYRNLVR